MLLVHFLRGRLGLTGTHWDATPATAGRVWSRWTANRLKSCTMLAVMAEVRAVRTVEGLATDGVLDPCRRASCSATACQCGFCKRPA